MLISDSLTSPCICSIPYETPFGFCIINAKANVRYPLPDPTSKDLEPSFKWSFRSSLGMYQKGYSLFNLLKHKHAYVELKWLHYIQAAVV